MDEAAFHLEVPEAAQLWLKSFADPDRRHGHWLFTNGCVTRLEALSAGTLFTARVRDNGNANAEFQTSMSFTDQAWSGKCDCGFAQCAHQFALGSAVVAEHRTGVVRQLSGSLARTLDRSPGAGEPPIKGGFSSEPLDQQLRVAVGRPLNGTEAAFLRKFSAIYKDTLRTRTFSSWRLRDLGRWFKHFYPANDLWPSFPQTELEFWLHIAYALSEQGGEIPEFMLPITNLEPIEKRMSAWEHAREIQRWRSLLGAPPDPAQAPPQENDSPGSAGLPAQALPLVDLRLRFSGDQIRLQHRASESEPFADAGATDLSGFAAELVNGSARRFTGEAELIVEVLQRLGSGVLIWIPHLRADQLPAIRRLFQSKALESRIVDASGQPLRRVAEPLRWQLAEPGQGRAEDKDAYRLELAQADGSPAPKFLCVLPGKPTLYLAQDRLFKGPATPSFVDARDPVAAIPVEAIESAAGYQFLRRLRIPIPDRLSQRLRVYPLEVFITCELRDPAAFNRSGPAAREECLLTFRAQAADGHVELWTLGGWTPHSRSSRRNPAPEPSAPGAGGKITVYDDTAAASFPQVIAPLNLKPGWDGQWTTRVTKKFPETFSAWLRALPPGFHAELRGELASFLDADVAGSVRLDISEAGIDWFDLRVVLDVADATLTPEEIRLLLSAKGRYVRLEGKGWRRLKFNLDEGDDEQLARLGLNPRELSDEPQRLHALQLADPAAKKFLPAAQLRDLQRRAEELKLRVAPQLPAGVRAELRPYQLEGYHFLAYLSSNHFGGILADDMGLGKTLQALAWLLWLRAQPAQPPAGNASVSPAPSLIVCPKSVMDNWHAESGRFTPELRVRCWAPDELPRLADETAAADLHVINYNQLRAVGESLFNTRWLAVVLDEGQYIKNPNSQTARIARALSADNRLVLTGTPIENRLLDLWSLMAFAMPGVLGNPAQFARLYDSRSDPLARRRLSARVRPFLLRRTKAQVAPDLPDRIEEELFCEIEGQQQALYRAELKRAQQLLLGVQTQSELAQQQFNFLTSLLRLRQICCHPKLVQPDASQTGAKTEALLEQLEPLMDEGEKVLVFSQFVQMLDLLRPEIEARGWPVFYLAGHTEQRGALVRDFQESTGPAVFLISLKAGGFGLNLTAANYVVLFDPWWNPAVENQAIDRTHRIGQTAKVIAYRLLIKNSVEEKIRELQKKKKSLAEDVLGEEKFAQSLTLDDLRFLFSD